MICDWRVITQIPYLTLADHLNKLQQEGFEIYQIDLAPPSPYLESGYNVIAYKFNK